MQQYKQARENNPQLKYWDWKKYADGGTIDEIPPQTTSERPITNFDPKGDPYNPTYGYNPGAGYVRSVFDLYDAPVIGDALSIYDATQALKNKDWLGAGLAALTVVPFIPTVSNYKKSLNQQLNRITGITPDISKLQKQSDWNDLRNRSIERLYDPEVRARAAKIKSDYNVDLQSTMEQNAYGINMLDRLKELNIKPTKQNILKYLKSLPDTDSIKKAALQFKNLDDYIKWLNTMPLADNGNINEIENYNFA